MLCYCYDKHNVVWWKCGKIIVPCIHFDVRWLCSTEGSAIIMQKKDSTMAQEQLRVLCCLLWCCQPEFICTFTEVQMVDLLLWKTEQGTD